MKDIIIEKGELKEILAESLKNALKGDGYSNPTRELVNRVVKDAEGDLEPLLREVLQEVVADKEFKEIVKQEFKHKVAKILVGDLSGSIEKAVNSFRNDPRLKADMVQAIERIVSDK